MRRLYRVVLLLMVPLATLACREPARYPEAHIEFSYVVPAADPLRITGSELGSRSRNHMEDQINGLHLMLARRGSSGGLSTSNSNEQMPGVDAALFATAPVVNAAILPLPDTGGVFFLWRSNGWESPRRISPQAHCL